MSDTNSIYPSVEIMRLIREQSYEAVISALIEACRGMADYELGRLDNREAAEQWEVRAQALEGMGNE